ncbi:MAG: HD-GYP domain-containing protein [Ectothiorhodospiraceae bacterium]
MAVGDLRLGLYVAALDRPWVETPFLFQGFTLEDVADIERLQELCRHVYVDAERSRVPVPEPSRRPVPRRRVDFHESVRLAAQSRENGRRFMHDVFRDIRLGHSVDAPRARQVVSDMATQVARDAEASLWLTNLKNRDAYTSFHCLNVCVLTLAFCQFLGYSREEMEPIGLGALLHDIGKIDTPPGILDKRGALTEAEFAAIKRHPVDGYERLRQSPRIPELALTIVRSHHERVGGQGYPDGLAGDAVIEPVRIVGIADCYDALTSDRPYRNSMPAQEVLGLLHDQSERDFGRDFVEAFIRCVGIYPVGSLVELDSGALGLVISAEPDQRLAPRILLIRSPDGLFYPERRIIDPALRPDPIRVRRVVNATEHGVDIQALLLKEARMPGSDRLQVAVGASASPPAG